MLRLKCSVHGLKQSNYNFYQKLSKALEVRNILSYTSDSYIFVLKNLIVLVCVNDILIFSKKKTCIDLFIKSLTNGEENFKLTDEGNIDKCLGVDMKGYAVGSYEI